MTTGRRLDGAFALSSKLKILRKWREEIQTPRFREFKIEIDCSIWREEKAKLFRRRITSHPIYHTIYLRLPDMDSLGIDDTLIIPIIPCRLFLNRLLDSHRTIKCQSHPCGHLNLMDGLPGTHLTHHAMSSHQ